LAFAGCGATCDESPTGWTQADRLFRGDRSWLGADGAYSVDLGDRVLWLFGDTFVSPDGSGSRSGSPFARNTIAVESGHDPTADAIAFYYRHDGGAPSAFFPAPDGTRWYWPGPGVRVGGALLVFLSRLRPGGGLGFVTDGSEARLIANPDDAPDQWNAQSIALPQNPWGVLLGTGAIFVEDGYLHLFSCVEPGNHDVYLVRWPLADAATGTLADPEWLVDGNWLPQSQVTSPPQPLFNGHTEFSVHFDATTKLYIQLQQPGFFFGPDITMRTAPLLTGPWSAARTVYRPPEAACPNVVTYAAKAHPELRAPSGVAVTYATSSTDFATQVNDVALYYPRFILLDVASSL